LEIELWRIGGSPVAPKFNVVSKPNDVIKGGGAGDGAVVITETKQLQQDYWRAFREFLAARKSSLKPQKAAPQHWLNMPIGRSNFHMAATVNTREERIGVELYIQGGNAKRHFKRLEADKAEIEKETGQPLDWQELPQKEACRIILTRKDSSFKDVNRQPTRTKRRQSQTSPSTHAGSTPCRNSVRAAEPGAAPDRAGTMAVWVSLSRWPPRQVG
jgi:hypothetical protein